MGPYFGAYIFLSFSRKITPYIIDNLHKKSMNNTLVVLAVLAAFVFVRVLWPLHPQEEEAHDGADADDKCLYFLQFSPRRRIAYCSLQPRRKVRLSQQQTNDAHGNRRQDIHEYAELAPYGADHNDHGEYHRQEQQ